MRLSFPNNEHADVLLAQGETAIGSAEDNTVVLDHPGIEDHHISFELSERSTVLRVRDSSARVHVNARPIRAMAMLHLGDIVSLGTIQLVLKPDRDDSVRVDPPTASNPADARAQGEDNSTEPSRVVLRGVSGTYFGKSIPVGSRLVIGHQADAGLQLEEAGVAPHHAQIENVGNAIFLRDLGSSNGTWVNGVQVRDAVLYPDDQIAFERNRFLLEAPGLPMRDSETRFDDEEANITQTLRAVPKPQVEPENPAAVAGNSQVSSGLWWLIGVAAVIAAGIAILFFMRV